MSLRWWKRTKRSADTATPDVVVREDGELAEDISEVYQTDDRNVFTETDDSSAIATQILECAQRVAATKQPGEVFSVFLESRHPSVHHMEITFGVMMNAGRYGLESGTVFNNKYEFTKR